MQVHEPSILLTTIPKYFRMYARAIPIHFGQQAGRPNDQNSLHRAFLCRPGRGARYRKRPQPLSLRSHLLCSVRQIGKALDRPLELIPARWTSVRHPIERLHHARVGVTPKTLANHKANLRAALRWYGQRGGRSLQGSAARCRVAQAPRATSRPARQSHLSRRSCVIARPKASRPRLGR